MEHIEVLHIRFNNPHVGYHRALCGRGGRQGSWIAFEDVPTYILRENEKLCKLCTSHPKYLMALLAGIE